MSDNQSSEKKHKSYNWLLGVSWLVTFVILILPFVCHPPDVGGVNDLAWKDSLRIERNKNGEEVAKNILILADRDAFKKMYFAKDSDYQRLQKMVDKNTLSATLIKNTTSFTGTTKTEIKWDTVEVEGEKIYPTYITSFKNKWISDTIIANKDSTELRLKVYNEYEIIQNWERPKWYKQKQPMIEVTNKNPYTETTTLKSFAVATPPKKRALFFVLGALAGAGAFYYFSK